MTNLLNCGDSLEILSHQAAWGPHSVSVTSSPVTLVRSLGLNSRHLTATRFPQLLLSPSLLTYHKYNHKNFLEMLFPTYCPTLKYRSQFPVEVHLDFIQAYPGGIAGSVPNHSNKASAQ